MYSVASAAFVWKRNCR